MRTGKPPRQDTPRRRVNAQRMMRRERCLVLSLSVLGLLSLAAAAPVPAAEDYPSAALSNGQVRLTVYLPDPRKGYYRGPRFDWSGQVAQAEYKGHTFFKEWRTPHDPTNFEHGIGTAEEFGTPTALGHAEAKPGETFVKIGVGVLEKPQEDRYRFFHPYRFVRTGTWKTERGMDWIEFRQELSGDRGYAYAYTKRIALAKDAPVFTISRTLKNTGSRPLETTHYGHNFVLIDNTPVGEAYRLRLPWAAAAREGARLQGNLQVKGNELAFGGAVERDKPVYADLTGFGVGLRDHHVEIENTRTGAAMTIRGDLPLSRFAFYAADTAACPEPFVTLALRPGEAKSWSTTYTLSAR